MVQTFQHLAKSQMQQSDKEKSKKVIRLWKSGKVYTEEFLSSIEAIMDRTAAPPGSEDINTVHFTYRKFILFFIWVGHDFNDKLFVFFGCVLL